MDVYRYDKLVQAMFRGEMADAVPEMELTPDIVDQFRTAFASIRKNLGLTIGEIFDKATVLGQDPILEACDYFISWKWWNQVPLTETERMIEAYAGLVNEVNNGGFHQYFFNSSGDNWPFVWKLLSDGKEVEGMQQFQELISIFPPDGPSVTRSVRWEQLDAIQQRDEEGMWCHFDNYSRAFFKQSFPTEETLWLVIFARQHDIQPLWM